VQPTSSKAIVALVLGIVSILICTLAGIAAIVVGNQARRDIRHTGEAGDGMALAGVILGWVALGLTVLGILVFVTLIAVGVLASSG
jgi:hypothetical protein